LAIFWGFFKKMSNDSIQMRMRPKMIWTYVLTLWAVLTPATNAAAPNVVLIITDDQGWGDVGAHGNTQLQTPNLDSLAREGVSMQNFYACAVCAPTRAELLTGRYHRRSGVRGVQCGLERMDSSERTVADELKASGYITGAFGKWHNGGQWPYHPMARGFDEFYGFTSGHHRAYFDPELEHQGEPVQPRGYIADVLTDAALSFIYRNQGQPFFCYLALNTPHSPWSVPPEKWAKFKDKPITQTASEPERENIDQTRATLAMCENIDDNVGRVLARLEALNLRDKTLVIFTSDNGPNSHRWNGGMKGKKGTIEEGGLRVPFFMRYPGRLPAGKKVTHPAAMIDLLPTLRGLGCITTPPQTEKPLDGRDLTSLLLRSATPETAWPERTLFTFFNGVSSLRTSRHRYHSTGELYDLFADPGQKTNRAAQEPELVKNLQSQLSLWQQDIGIDPTRPVPKIDPRPITVGALTFLRTSLPAGEAEYTGAIKRSSAPAPNHSYLTQWQTPDDRITWPLEVITAGVYEVELRYTCPLADAGATIELSHGESRLSGTVTPGWDPPIDTRQDTIPRPVIESPSKDFRTLKLGTISLQKTTAPLTLRATHLTGKNVMDLYELILRHQP
jgi:arylsulfatase A-like enzyme